MATNQVAATLPGQSNEAKQARMNSIVERAATIAARCLTENHGVAGDLHNRVYESSSRSCPGVASSYITGPLTHLATAFWTRGDCWA